MSRIAKRLGLDVFDIPMGLFDCSVRVAIGDFKATQKYAGHIFELSPDWDDLDNPETEARGRLFYSPGYVPILWLPAKPVTPREYATLAHEAVHASWEVMKWSGSPMVRETEEVQAHIVGHIVNEVLEHCK